MCHVSNAIENVRSAFSIDSLYSSTLETIPMAELGSRVGITNSQETDMVQSGPRDGWEGNCGNETGALENLLVSK